MKFKLEHTINSIAGQLKRAWPEIPVYSNPNQQGTETPCFFIFFMPVEIENRIGRRMQRNVGIDVVYLTERNTTDSYDEMVEIGDTLDFMLEFVCYTDGTETQKLRTYEREWEIEDGEMHYQFYIKPIVSVPDNTPLIEEIEKLEGGIEGEGHI